MPPLSPVYLRHEVFASLGLRDSPDTTGEPCTLHSLTQHQCATVDGHTVCHPFTRLFKQCMMDNPLHDGVYGRGRHLRPPSQPLIVEITSDATNPDST